MGRIERTPQPTHLGEYFKQANNLPRFTREQNDFLFRSLKEEKSLDDIRHHPDFIKTIPMDTQEEDKYRNAFLQAKDYEHQSKDIPVKKLIALGNLGLVVSAAKELGVLSFSERLQSGNEGLVKAINSFDPDYAEHISFSDYAAISIKNTIKKATYKNRIVSIPEEVEQAVSEAWKVAGSHIEQHDRLPTKKKWKQELNKQTDLDESQIERAMYVIFSGISKPASLNATVTENEQLFGREIELGDTIPDTTETTEEKVMRTEITHALKDAIDALPEAQKHVVTNYYEREISLREAGKEIGISSELATKRKNQALAGLRKNDTLLKAYFTQEEPLQQDEQHTPVSQEIILLERKRRRELLSLYVSKQKEVDTTITINNQEKHLPRKKKNKYLSQIEDMFTAANPEEQEAFLSKLTPRNKKIIAMRLGLEGQEKKPQNEIAQEFGISASMIAKIEERAANKLTNQPKEISIKSPTKKNTLSQIEDMFTAANPEEQEAFLSKLTPRNKKIIAMRLGLEGQEKKPQNEIAQEMGITRQMISLLEKEILKQLLP